jgi:hypothetical protein
MYYRAFVTTLKLLKFMYDIEAFRAPRRLVGEPAKVRVDPSAPAANTQGTTPRRIKIRPRWAPKTSQRWSTRVRENWSNLRRPRRPPPSLCRQAGHSRFLKRNLFVQLYRLLKRSVRPRRKMNWSRDLPKWPEFLGWSTKRMSWRPRSLPRLSPSQPHKSWLLLRSRTSRWSRPLL